MNMPDWDLIRAAVEAGESVQAASDRFGVSTSQIYAKAAKHDWGGRMTKRRREQIVDMLLKAAGKVAGAADAREAELQAKALTAIAAVVKALKEIDPRIAGETTGGGEEDPEDIFRQRQAFNAEVERLIELRVAERLEDARGRD